MIGKFKALESDRTKSIETKKISKLQDELISIMNQDQGLYTRKSSVERVRNVVARMDSDSKARI